MHLRIFAPMCHQLVHSALNQLQAGVQHGLDAAVGSQQGTPAAMTTSSDDSPPR
jgi:hypothetical protein